MLGSLSDKGAFFLEFSTTLLREKFVIHDGGDKDTAGHPLTAVSNRLIIPLLGISGQPVETFIVRAQTMHACIRMGAKIVQTYLRAGPLMIRTEKFSFADAWDQIVDEHDRKFNPDRWVAVYYNGKLVYGGGTHHSFLDMVEKCESRNPGNYDLAIKLAEDAFAQLGKQVTIVQDTNIGMVTTISDDHAKCGLILRNPNRRTTFNFIAERKGDANISISQCLIVAAAYLEGIQLAFHIGMTNERLRQGKIIRYGEDDRKADSARRRLGMLNTEIRSFENTLNVRYRPEKPEFAQMVIEAEHFTFDLLKPRYDRPATSSAPLAPEEPPADSDSDPEEPAATRE